ncbi:hypothetical protein [uncultured Bacteroides sp.]|uniref:hypothetical protein n=1 Tax=uncultured Bacteroides sp. TaxID=162156 RepID=UPI00345CA2E3
MVGGSLSVAAQSSTNSPYTRYGLGELAENGFTNNAAMGGIGYGLRSPHIINMINPASYSAVDSLSFMFDVGMSLKSSNYKEQGFNNNAKNSSFDNLAIQFRLHPRLGLAFGFIPYTTLGYSFNTTNAVDGNSNVTATNVFYGDGGLQMIMGGLGFKILDNLSIGVNAGYLYGKLNYQSSVSFNTTSDQTIVYNKLKVNSYVASLGIQYTQNINKNDNITLGMVYSLGHDLNSEETQGTQVTDNSSYTSTTEKVIEDSYGIPSSFGLGAVYNHKANWTIGADYTLQKWSKTKYNNLKNAYTDRSKMSVGAEFLPNPMGRNYLKRIRYRVGAYYATPYLKLPQCEGPSEYGISAGFSLPLYMFQRNSILNITGQYVHVSPSVSNMLSENRFVIKIGLTFNEHWFMKWKVN